MKYDKFPTFAFACLAGLTIFSFFFALAAFTDFVYSDCINVGTHFMSCISGAQILYPLVGPVGHGYLLGSFATPDGMGRVAGISFLWIFAMFFLWEANRKGRSYKRLLWSIADGFALCSVVYILFMAGVVIFIPYCLAGSCRISNEIPWLNYIQGFYIAVSIFGAFILISFWSWILKERKRLHELQKKVVEPIPGTWGDGRPT